MKIVPPQGKRDLDILLVLPPIWSPVMPFLSLPTLTGYLRAQNISVSQVDLSLEFFVNHVLTKPFLFRTLGKLENELIKGKKTALSEEHTKMLHSFLKNESSYHHAIEQVDNAKKTLKDKELFFDIQLLLNAQSTLYKLLSFVSTATYPYVFTFNTFNTAQIKNFRSLFQFFDDEKNIFKDFYQTFIPNLIASKPSNIIGISICTSNQLVPGLYLAWFLKENYKDKWIVLGGKYIERVLDAFLNNAELAMKICDFIIIGDGEIPLEGLLSAFKNQKNPENIPNTICFLRKTPVFPRNEYVPITQRPHPDFSDLPLKEYLSPYPLLPIRLSEGCYWGKCTFCSRYDNRRFETLPVEEAVSLIEDLSKKHQTHVFMINDDCLTPNYLERFAKGILRKGIKVNFSLWAKPVSTFTKERLRLLSEAGFKLIRWGVETGNERILKLMNKGTNIPDTISVMRYSYEEGIWNHAMVIFGFPTETEQEALDTLRFLEKYSDCIQSSIFFKFSLLRHSHIYNNPQIYSINIIEKSDNEFSFETNFECSLGMDKQQIDNFYNEAQGYRLKELYGYPAWFYMRIREYLFLYLTKHHAHAVQRWKVEPESHKVYNAGEHVEYVFLGGEEITDDLVERLKKLIMLGGEVGTSWVEDNLKEAVYVGYAIEKERIIGTMTHKRPKEKYLKYLYEKTGLDLKGYLERGYSFVRPEYRGLGIGDKLLKGLVAKTPDEKIYVTIRLDNIPAIKLTTKNNMKLKASFTNEKTGHLVGIFVNG